MIKEQLMKVAPPLPAISTDERRRALKLRKRARKKLKRHNKKPATTNISSDDSEQAQKVSVDAVEYTIPAIDLTTIAPLGKDIVNQFAHIFKHFDLPDTSTVSSSSSDQTFSCTPHIMNSLRVAPTSKRKWKKSQRYTVDELKLMAPVPELVEKWDCSAPDPLLFVDLKSYRNTVPVPQHWRQKQKYLYFDVTEDKPPFELPRFIKDTGVMEARDNLKQQERQKRQKTKTRERRRPKLANMDLEYQALYDAFFKFQTKPNLSLHGDLYFERKERKSKYQNKKPGELSNELKEALGISSPLTPPPWLIQMQRYGPPPSYPYLKIPGLNAPPPDDAQWGLQRNGWGLIPVDAFGRPLYDGVVKTAGSVDNEAVVAQGMISDTIRRQLWGELDDSKDNDDEDVESDNEIDRNIDRNWANDSLDTTRKLDEEVIRVIPIKMDVEAELQMEKNKRRRAPLDSKDHDGVPLKLYDIIPPKPATTTTTTTTFMAPQNVYDMSSSSLKHIGHGWNRSTDVTVSLDPSELTDSHLTGLTKAAVYDKYQQAQKEHLPEGIGDQELKTMYTSHARRQAKRKRQIEISNTERKKEFKF